MTLLDHTPRFSVDDAVTLCREQYGVRAIAEVLPSERDQNFLLRTDNGEKFVFKIANAHENRALLEAQQAAMMRVTERTSLCQRVIPNLAGRTITEIESRDGQRHLAWLVAYLDGRPLGTVKRHSPELLRNLGRCLGQTNRALAGFDHPAAHRDFHWDLQNGLRVIRQNVVLIANDELRRLVEKLTDELARTVAPLLPALRRSVIHNDANDYNVLVGGGDDLSSRNQSVVGVIDFGDMVYSYTVGDLAIAIAYAILDKTDPLAAAMEIVKGWHAEFALTETELAALFGLVQLRLCISVCHAAQQMRERPDDEYLAISQQPIRRTLPRLAQIAPRFAEAAFRHACGFAPVSNSDTIVNWLRANAENFSPVIGVDLRRVPCVVFDLSVSSSLLSGDESENAESQLTKRLFDLMKDADVRVGIGRYDEARLLYTTPAFTAGANPFDEHRTIHLGLDLFAEAGTPVYAPLAATVHAFQNNAAPLDYGPVIILKHETDDGLSFFTLYGHLSEDSLTDLFVGKKFAAGERFATIGTPPTNGNWTPHLHLQLITDLLKLNCDYPGVGRASHRALWHCLSPDPNLLLGIPAERFPEEAPDKTETLIARRQRLGRNLSIAYRDPVKIVRGWRQYLFDDNGRRYLDAYNNVPHVGHCHPRIVKAATEQMRVLNTNTRYLHDTINRYAERLCATLPAPLSVCFFVNSASEANELALRLARAYTRQREMIVLEAAYHGHTSSLIDISPYKHDGPGGGGAPAWVHTAPIADTYRGAYKRDDPQAGVKYAQHVQAIIERLHEQESGLAGFIAETCPSVGGQIFFPDGYLDAVYRFVRAAGGLCIADEVQTGYGRIGTHFWAFEAHNVVPDIVVMGKPIGNGFPLGALVTTPDIADAFNNGMEFFSTFGGSTVSCAVGLEVLNVVQEEQLQQHALRVGERMLTGLRPFTDRYEIVGDVRGSGLFLGVELVRDRITLEPADHEASFIVNRLRERGILAGTDGPFHNVVKIRPPMPFDERNADFLIETMAQILAADFLK